MTQIQMASMTKISVLFASFVLISASLKAVDPSKTTEERETRGQLYSKATLRYGLEQNNSTDHNRVKISGIDTTERLEIITEAQSIKKHHGGLEFENVTSEKNGTREGTGNEGNSTIAGQAHLVVSEKPEIELFIVNPVGVGSIELKWKVNDGNDPVTKYSIKYEKSGTNIPEQFGEIEIIRGKDSMYNLKSEKLKRGVAYKLSIEATNSVGVSPKFYSNEFTPLKKDRTGWHETRSKLRLNERATLSCRSNGNNFTDYGWSKISGLRNPRYSNNPEVNQSAPMTLTFENVTRNDRGTYKFWGANNSYYISNECDLIVTEVPEVKIEESNVRSPHSVELRWTVINHDEPVTKYFVAYQTHDVRTEGWKHYEGKISPRRSSIVVKELESSTWYQFRINATNSVGDSVPAYSKWIMTPAPEPDPNFLPLAFDAMQSGGGIKINFKAPSSNLRKYDYCYNVKVTQRGKTTLGPKDSAVNAKSFTIPNLKPETYYAIKIKACYANNKNKRCGNWSTEKTVYMERNKVKCSNKIRRGCDTSNTEGSILDMAVQKFKKNISAGLHPAGINLAPVIAISLYIAVKYV